MKKNVMALLLSASLLGGCMGCAGKEAKTGGQQDDIPELVWYVPGKPQNDIDKVMEKANEFLVPEIGAKLKLTFIEDSAYQEKMKMYMASKSQFDLCFVGYLLSSNSCARNGATLPLRDLIKENCPDLLNSMPEYAWKAAEYNGDYYCVPNYQINAMTDCLAVRKDMAEKYNLDTSSVTKTEDIVPFLEKIRDNEPTLIPISMVAKVWDEPLWGGAYEYFGTETMYFNQNTKKLYPVYEVPELKEAWKKGHEFYEKGFIQKDIASAQDISSKQASGQYVVSTTVYKPGVETTLKDSLGGYDYTCMQISKPTIARNSPTATAIAVSKQSKHPDKAVKLISLLNTNKEFYNLICFGIEGVHYTKTGENRIELKENSSYKPLNAWKFGNQLNAYILPGQDDNVWEETDKMNKEAMVSPLLGFAEDNTSVATEIAQMEKISQEYIVSRLNKGAENPDEYWDEFVSKMKEAGIEKVVAEYQRQIDEFLSK